MKQLVGTVVLRNRVTTVFDAAEVFQEIDDKNTEDFEQLWRPILLSGAARDSHWKWAEKAKAASQLSQYETFAVECAGATQGMMLLNLLKNAKLESQSGRELAYVELLATAPWNRSRLVKSARYKGVGRVLIGTAISMSVELGFKGRIGLHSLEDSESWYRDTAGFTDIGYDAAKKMRYFEMTEAQAAAFLSIEGGGS